MGSWQISVDSNLFHARAVGAIRLDDVIQLFRMVREEGERNGCSRFLVDNTGSIFSLSVTEVYSLSSLADKIEMPRLWRFALVFPDPTTDTSILEVIAMNSGYLAKVFRSVDAATEWLNAEEA